MNRREPHTTAYLAARTIRFIMAWGVPTDIALDALNMVIRLLHDTKTDVSAQHWRKGAARLH